MVSHLKFVVSHTEIGDDKTRCLVLEYGFLLQVGCFSLQVGYQDTTGLVLERGNSFQVWGLSFQVAWFPTSSWLFLPADKICALTKLLFLMENLHPWSLNSVVLSK